jgi:predicted PurR-regulated permease PerM
VVDVVLLLIILSSLGLSGLAVVEQVQSLINFLLGALKDLPDTLSNLASQSFEFGPFKFNFQLMDVNMITQQILGAVEPILAQAGASVVTVATKIGTAIGLIFFILLVSYFVLAESGGSPNQLIRFSIPGYEDDIALLSQALGNIWNSFLRGQLTIVLITIVVYNIILGGLRVNYFFGLAVLAGMARFVPYVGPFIAWTTYGLVAFFQGSTIFGLPPIGYVALIVGCAWMTDLVMDNVIVPRLMGNALRVHPAAVMVSALVALNLLGVIGVVLAAPVLATVQLIFEYTMAKLLDQNPWVRIGKEIGPASAPQPIWQNIKRIFTRLYERLSKENNLRKVFLRK